MIKRVTYILLLAIVVVTGLVTNCFSSKPLFSVEEEGILQFRCYTVYRKDSFQFKKAISIADTATYLIKGHKVFREASTTKIGSQVQRAGKTGNLDIEISSPQYLMDFDKRVYYKYDKGPHKIYSKKLSDLQSDFLYHPLIQHSIRTQLLNVDTSRVFMENGIKMYRGLALMTDTKDTAVFKCAVKPLPLKSPLNHWVPDVKYDIVAIGLSAKSQDPGVGDGWLMLEIYNVERKKMPEERFEIDVTQIVPE